METVTSIETANPIAEDTVVKSDSRTLSEDGGANESSSTKPDDQDPDVNTSCNGLTLVSTLEPDLVDGDPGDAIFDIDVVHVLGVSMRKSPLFLSFLSESMATRYRRRQYRFEYDVLDMLNDDVEFTEEYFESQARQLLRALADFRRSDDQPGQRVTIFFTYDVGAVILKKAIAIASNEAEGHIETFTSIARIIFGGCFNRGGEQELGLKLHSFLSDASDTSDGKKEAIWKPRITLSSVQSLVSTMRTANAAFLASKISLRSRTFSLYAGSSSRRIHSTMGFSFATLGLSSELALQEEDSEDLQAAFPGLMESISASMDSWAFLGSSQVSLERSILSLVAPEAQLVTTAPSHDHPVLDSDTYDTWRRRVGTQLMHIKGVDPRATTEAAEQLSIDWIKRQQSNGLYYPRSFVFRFCASDPARNSITAMLAAFILHFFRVSPGVAQDHQEQLQDQYKLQNAWTEEDLCRMALNSYCWMGENSPLVLLGLDECDPASRSRFWALIGTIASRTEDSVRIIVTASRPDSYNAYTLRQELKEWSEVSILEWEVPDESNIDVDSEGEANTLLAWLCPPPSGMARVLKALQGLQSMPPNVLSRVLRMVTLYSMWPAEKTKENFTVFLDTIDLVELSYTPRETVWAILRSALDQELVMTVLTWTLGAQRPITSMELAGIVVFSRNIHDKQMVPPEANEIQRCSREINRQIRGFAILEEGYFRIHPDVLGLLAGGSTDTLKEVKERAPRLTAGVLLQYLRVDAIQKRLHTVFQEYDERIRQSGDAITPPITQDGKDMLFYAVHALPHHLSAIKVPQDVEEQMRDPSGPYGAWSKVYWAMSNSFSRPSLGPLESAWSTWESSPEFGEPNMLSLRGVHGPDKEQRSPMKNLAEAVRANNEALAIKFAREVISDFEHQPDLGKEKKEKEVLTFPPPILWRATWLDMDRLLALLLSYSKQQDDKSAAFPPSMLYLACRIGSSKSVDVLLSNDADVRVRRKGVYTPLYTACAHGFVDIVRSLLNRDPTLLTIAQPQTPLYLASFSGCWGAVELLLDSGADPSQPRKDPEPEANDDMPKYDWLPITVVCSQGNLKTARFLLEHGANPNEFGPTGMDTCLWLAAMHSGDLDTMKALLEHGADPNHENLQPPLLIEIINGKKLSENTKLSMFDLLLDNDPPVELDRAQEGGGTPLIVAAQTGSLFAVQWLLEKGASINALDSGNHTALYIAIVEGKWDVVHLLLGHREKPRLDLVCVHGQTQLQTAMGNIDELSKLLEAGSDPNFLNKWEQTLLDCAVAAEKTEVVKMLLEPGRGSDVHHRDDDGWSPIMVATGHAPNQEIARMLMEAGASFSDVTSVDNSPLHLAAWKSQPDVLQVLLDFHESDDLARKNVLGETPLLAVCDFTSEETLQCIRLLVRAGSDINSQDKYGQTLLIQSAEVGPQARAIHNWLLARPKIDTHLRSNRSGTALHASCEYGDEELINMLLQKGADANSQNMCLKSTPLIAACMPLERTDGDESTQSRIETAEKIARVLVAKGAEVSLTSGTIVFNALCAAALCAGVGTINFILDKAASIRTPDPLGRLPIHFAAANGIRNFEAVALAHGGDIMVPDNFGKNALHWASQVGNAETVRAILQKLSPKDKKRYVNSEDVDGWTPLAWASRTSAHDFEPFWIRSEPQNYEATIQHLVDHGGDISVCFRMDRGSETEVLTPLRMAKRCEADMAVIKLLTPDGESASSQSEDEPVYWKSSGFCDFCFSQARGIMYHCETCDEGRYWICKKCLPSGSVEHPRSATFKGPHNFDSGTDGEFIQRSTPSVAAEEAAAVRAEGAQVGGNVGERADDSTPEFEPMDFREDDIEQLDFPDLNDLGNLDDL